ncbi:hypothetical protein OsJ_09879 [Oryza sativa Japonica Group]|uniref:DUF7887 domain-containing protein n=3 Tax=Oryza TaxID=4527 RepID=A0A8J8YH16_ORYSJ|nr:uncharacterized protein LOC9269613 [Oryza sativa Japonica Group]ABF94596.1 expressed protein [Oryza sativa Japonica Group]EAZ26026.1 hypothetical protein OsJ_09879 [Oryza sativa Japonica Group]KAF2937945.1 hypothetical protein DAI22_03g085300 [Oryza sativa Japonica Group]
MPAWPAAAVAKAVPSPSTPPPPHSRGAGRRRLRPCGAKKGPGTDERGATAGGGGVVTRGALLRSGAALFALGFVDAGYSGDWSRIGAISKDTEEALKLAAYAVVPLCLAVVFSPSSEDGSNNT